MIGDVLGLGSCSQVVEEEEREGGEKLALVRDTLRASGKSEDERVKRSPRSATFLGCNSVERSSRSS